MRTVTPQQERLVLLSARHQAFFRHLRASYALPNQHLLRIIADKTHPPLARAAALRILVATAPIDVTQGRPFLERRWLVREHYRV